MTQPTKEEVDAAIEYFKTNCAVGDDEGHVDALVAEVERLREREKALQEIARAAGRVVQDSSYCRDEFPAASAVLILDGKLRAAKKAGVI